MSRPSKYTAKQIASIVHKVAKRHKHSIDPAWRPKNRGVRAVFSGDDGQPFADFYAKREGVSYVNSEFLYAVCEATGAESADVGLCDDGIPSEGMNVTLWWVPLK